MSKDTPPPIGHNNPPTLAERLKLDHADLFKRARAWTAKAKKADLKPKTEDDCAVLNKLFADGDALIKEAASVHTKEKEPFLRDGKIVDAAFNAGIRDVLKPDADEIRQAAADKLLAITRERQRLADIEADRVRERAEQLAEQAAKQESAGKVREADKTQAQAEALETEADRLEASASQGLRDASRTFVGGVSASVGAKLVCTGVDRPKLDLETLRPFLKEDALIAAVEAYLKAGNKTLTGAIIVEKAVGSVRRK